MPVAAGNEVTTTELQQAIFGAPPSSLPAPPSAPAASAKAPEVLKKVEMDIDGKEEEPKGLKRARDDESDDEGAPMEEDSDAPMEASSDEDD